MLLLIAFVVILSFFSWSRFDETVSAEIYRQNLIWPYLSL
jgi:hypothetical protein